MTGGKPGAHRLCRLDDIADGAARGFDLPRRGRQQHRRIFLLRLGEAVLAYRDACPHMGLPLPWAGDAYLTGDGRFIRCAQHGALFRPEDGHCVAGPCRGERLKAERVVVADGSVWLV